MDKQEVIDSTEPTVYSTLPIQPPPTPIHSPLSTNVVFAPKI